MDGKYVTLKLLMDTLAEKNGLLDWNCFPQKNGKIMLKVQFKDGGHNDVNNSNLMDLNSVPTDMSNKDKHNYMRAKLFRENRCSKRPRSSSHSDTPEIVRNSDNCDGSHISNNHVCISPESLTHDVSTSLHSDCMPSDSAVNRNQAEMDPSESDIQSDLGKCQATTSTSDCNNLSTPIVPFDEEILPTPFDDEESLYDPDENPHHPWDENDQKDRRPCRDADCHYAEEPFDKFRWDIFKRKTNIYTCKLCGRKICDWCTWAKRRHLIHLKHFRNYSYDLPEGRSIDIEQLMSGNY